MKPHAVFGPTKTRARRTSPITMRPMRSTTPTLLDMRDLRPRLSQEAFRSGTPTIHRISTLVACSPVKVVRPGARSARSVRRSQLPVDPAGERGFTRQPNLSCHLPAITKHREDGDALDVMSRRRRRVLVRVELEHQHVPGPPLGDLLEHRRRHAARPTPGRPEVDEDRDRRGLEGVGETGFVHHLRLAGGVEGILASAADRLPCDPRLWNTVESGAMRTTERQHRRNLRTDRGSSTAPLPGRHIPCSCAET